MDKIVDLQNLKSKNYMSLSISLKEQLHAVSDMICAYQQANIETIEPTKKMCR